jgi:hypothetical protein
MRARLTELLAAFGHASCQEEAVVIGSELEELLVIARDAVPALSGILAESTSARVRCGCGINCSDRRPLHHAVKP